MAEFTEDIKLQVGRMFNDVYFGNGKPAITVRLERGENRMATIESSVDAIREHTAAMRSFVRNALIAIIGSAALVVGTLLADMIVKHWR